jgi:hypothetical protein
MAVLILPNEYLKRCLRPMISNIKFHSFQLNIFSLPKSLENRVKRYLFPLPYQNYDDDYKRETYYIEVVMTDERVSNCSILIVQSLN